MNNENFKTDDSTQETTEKKPISILFTAFHVDKPEENQSSLEIPTQEAGEDECEQYLSIIATAELVVDNIINEAIARLQDKTSFDTSQEVTTPREEGESRPNFKFIERPVSKMTWPSISQFTADLGKDKITQYIGDWKMEENWMFFVTYVGEYSDECSDYYQYEVKWSIPCKQYPVSQATASVYFTVEVSRVKPKKCPVNVRVQPAK